MQISTEDNHRPENDRKDRRDDLGRPIQVTEVMVGAGDDQPDHEIDDGEQRPNHGNLRKERICASIGHATEVLTSLRPCGGPSRRLASTIPAMQIDRSTAVEALAAEYFRLNEIIGTLRPIELIQSSGCVGWTNADLIFHMLLDAQRALVTLDTPADGSVDRDFVTYWDGFLATDGDSQDHARFVRINAASHRDPLTICSRWVGTATAAVRSSRTADVDRVSTQGHILNVGDFVATLVVEAAIHHLDLIRNLSGRAQPVASAVSITTATIDGLLGVPRPPGWSDNAYILKTTGRAQLTDDERTALGSASERLPVFS